LMKSEKYGRRDLSCGIFRGRGAGESFPGEVGLRDT
jgi:hypothetical protein